MYLDTLQKHTETLGNILLLVLCRLAPRESDNLLTKCGNLLSLPRHRKAQLDGKEVLPMLSGFCTQLTWTCAAHVIAPKILNLRMRSNMFVVINQSF